MASLVDESCEPELAYRYTIKAKKAMVREGVALDSPQVRVLERDAVFVSDATVDGAPRTADGAPRLRVLASGPKNGFGESCRGYVSAKVCEPAAWHRDFQGVLRGRCRSEPDACPGYKPPAVAFMG